MAKGKKFEPIQSNNIVRQEFTYKKADVTLAFTLRVDVQTELVIFRELMQKAVEDLTKKIDEMKK